jgi:hypothetical protein
MLPGPAPPSTGELEVEAIGCVIDVGLVGIAGGDAPAVVVVVVVVIDDGYSTAVTEDDVVDTGVAGSEGGIELDI